MLTIFRIRVLCLSLCLSVRIQAHSPRLEWRTQKSIDGAAHQGGHGSESESEGEGETSPSKNAPNVRLHQRQVLLGVVEVAKVNGSRARINCSTDTTKGVLVLKPGFDFRRASKAE